MKNEKVGIITFYHQNLNFGGLLQAYALPIALKLYLDINAEQIDCVFIYSEDFMQSQKKKKKRNISLYQVGILVFSKLKQKNLNKRRRMFDKFMEETPHSNVTYNYKTIKSCVKKYDAFICGGDQIWNDYNSKMDIEAFTLQFVPEGVKKISYAPSIANLEMSDEFKITFRKGLSGLNAISVREKSSIQVLQELTNKLIQVVVDPVLLLQKKEWKKIANVPQIKEPYLLCYLLGNDVSQRKSVKKLAKKLNLKILTFSHIFGNAVRKCDLFFGDIHDYTSGPREFIGLIQNAELVVTDSFHASVFSMIFETPFYVFERDKADAKNSTNRRIYDFLKEYQLDSQLVSEESLAETNKIPKVDFKYAHQHWEKRREESLEYLEHALEVKRRKHR